MIADFVSEPRAVATGLGTQSSRLPVHCVRAETKQFGRLRTQDPVATARGSDTFRSHLIGTCNVNRVPAPGEEEMSRRPPNCAARSRMFGRPLPPRPFDRASSGSFGVKP